MCIKLSEVTHTSLEFFWNLTWGELQEWAHDVVKLQKTGAKQDEAYNTEFQ